MINWKLLLLYDKSPWIQLCVNFFLIFDSEIERKRVQRYKALLRQMPCFYGLAASFTSSVFVWNFTLLKFRGVLVPHTAPHLHCKN